MMDVLGCQSGLRRRALPVSRRAGMLLGSALFLGGLFAVVAFQGEAFSRAKGVVFDETFYLNAGIRLYRHGDFGPLARWGAAPAPVLATYWIAPLIGSKDVASDEELWTLGPGDAAVIRQARRIHRLAAFALVAIVYTWLARRRGLLAAMVGSSLVALSPTLTASACVATTDYGFALMVLVTLAALVAYRADPRPARCGLLILALATALATKYSALILLVPVALLVAFDVAWRRYGARLWSVTTILAWLRIASVILLGAFAVATLMHGGNPLVMVHGVRQQAWHNAAGHSAMLCGMLSTTGWWYYFPVAFLLKSTPAELLLALAGLLLAPWSIRWLVGNGPRDGPPYRGKRRENETVPLRGVADASSALWCATLALLGVFAVTCRVNIGIRYILPVYPLLFLWTIDQAWLCLGARRRLLGLTGAALVGLQGFTAWQITPDYLSYFNLLAGGPAGGYRCLVDSNLDWGQDLPALARTLDQLSGKRVLLHYFGTDRPEDYGIRAVSWQGVTARQARACDVLAISATYLSGAYSEGVDPFRDFRALEPMARAGYSILLYDLRTASGRQALETALRRSVCREPRPCARSWVRVLTGGDQCPPPAFSSSRAHGGTSLRRPGATRAAPA